MRVNTDLAVAQINAAGGIHGHRLQVVYAGRPLYFYVGDPKGKILCGNVSEFGGLWLVVAASGKVVR